MHGTLHWLQARARQIRAQHPAHNHRPPPIVTIAGIKLDDLPTESKTWSYFQQRWSELDFRLTLLCDFKETRDRAIVAALSPLFHVRNNDIMSLAVAHLKVDILAEIMAESSTRDKALWSPDYRAYAAFLSSNALITGSKRMAPRINSSEGIHAWEGGRQRPFGCDVAAALLNLCGRERKLCVEPEEIAAMNLADRACSICGTGSGNHIYELAPISFRTGITRHCVRRMAGLR